MVVFYPILAGLTGVLFGSILDALMKAVATDISVLVVTAWRFVFGAAIAGTLYAFTRRALPTAEQLRFHAMRAIVQLCAAFSFFYALTQLGLAEATVLGFTAALMVPGLARFILKEKISKLSVLAIGVGFVGAAMATSGETQGAPDVDNRTLGYIAVLVAALTYALAVVLLRLRAQKNEDSLTLVMFSNVMPALFVTPIILWSLFSNQPGSSLPWHEVPPLIAASACAVATWWFLSFAYARAPAQRIAPLDYTALIWSGLFGAMIFGERPGWQLWAGASIIVIACLLVASESHFETRRQAKTSPSDVHP